MRMKKITKVEIITRENKFFELKHALNHIGVQGMTVTKVSGCGVQKGLKEKYRGVSYTPEVLPKIKIETVISEVPVEKVIEVTKKICHTGEVGDGKIFISDISNVIRIRNGDEGVIALNNEVN